MSDDNPLSYYNNLQEKHLDAIEGIVGADRVNCVKDAVMVYCIKKRFFDKRPPITELNKSIGELRKHSSAVIDLLSDSLLREYLLGSVAEELGVSSQKLIKGDMFPLLNKTPKFLVSEPLENLCRICEVVMKKQNSGKGRPKGSKDMAVHILINDLYRCCKFANGGKPLTNKSGNMLELLVAVLNNPLDLKGERPWIVRRVIETQLDEGAYT